MPYGSSSLTTLKVVTGNNPAAGAEVSDTVPTGKSWELVAVKVTLVTSAAAANRRPALALDDGTTEFWRFRAGVDQAASLTRSYWFLRTMFGEVDRSVTFNEMFEPMDDGMVLPQGGHIRTVTNALQAGDDWAAPVYYVAEYG